MFVDGEMSKIEPFFSSKFFAKTINSMRKALTIKPTAPSLYFTPTLILDWLFIKKIAVSD